MRISQAKVRNFREAFDPTFKRRYGGRMLNPNECLLTSRNITEESAEYVAACALSDPVKMADALADLIYVALDAANLMGIDLAEFFDEVHESNMTKTRATDGSGKILKGDKYCPPKLEAIWNLQKFKEEPHAHTT